LRLFTRIHSLEGIADQKSNIGYIYALLGEFESALRYFMDVRQDYGRLGMVQKEQDTITNIIQIEKFMDEDG